MVVGTDSATGATVARSAGGVAVPAPVVELRSEPMADAWSEGARTHAEELRALNEWMRCEAELEAANRPGKVMVLHDAVNRHLDAAEAAIRPSAWWHRKRTGARMQAALSNLDAAAADLLQAAPPFYLLGQMPSVLNDVQRHLKAQDVRRKEVENIFKAVKASDAPHNREDPDPRHALLDAERGKIVSAVRGASSASLREQIRLRSFRNLVVATTIGMAVVAITVGVIGLVSPASIPLCFAPEASGKATVVCPTEQSDVVAAPGIDSSNGTTGTDAVTDFDELINDTANRADIALVGLIGLAAAAISAAGAIRSVRGSSEPYGIPIALAVLKLPTGAVTAFVGMLLMRGGFVPGLSALDTSAQILAWAIVFGYSQQLFTRLVDQQAHTVLDSVRGGNKQTE